MTVPNFPPTRIVIEVDFSAEPRVIEDGGLTDYLLEAICTRVAMHHATTWELLEEGTVDGTE